MKDNKFGNEKKSGFEVAQEANAKDLAWEIFKKSGNINYYRLYSDLKKKDN